MVDGTFKEAFKTVRLESSRFKLRAWYHNVDNLDLFSEQNFILIITISNLQWSNKSLRFPGVIVTCLPDDPLGHLVHRKPITTDKYILAYSSQNLSVVNSRAHRDFSLSQPGNGISRQQEPP